MTEKDVIRNAMALRKWKYPTLAKEMKEKGFLGDKGELTSNNISGFMNNNKNGIRFDNVYKMLSAMGCEIIVRDIHHNKEWKIDMKEGE